ncbi:hypothetical protein LCGC14_0124220 [marine sediment metagenome]|uniref:Uroporphyrinogen decarboxylase (URO-D) domain-containing protein n=1 Tax=marine sediment metagenome TaxID=412755 RepID=A0A0F9VL87_9ZZZZ
MANDNGRGWQARLARQDRYFKEGKGNFLILGGYSEGQPERTRTHDIEGQIDELLSEPFLKDHAYDLGIQTALWATHELAVREQLDDDALPCHAIDFGVGSTASLFTGGEVSFHECTSYSLDTFVKTWDDIDRLRFDPDNRWVHYDLEFWRGFSSAYTPGLAISPHFFRSPPDLANDLRGNQLFIDMHDEPEQVDRLMTVCADMTIEAAAFLRNEIPLLREAPSGIWGMATSSPDIIVINGDTVDLISVEMGERFNHPHIDRIGREAGPVFFHHHTLGVSRVTSVAKMEGIIVQNFIYDMKAPKVLEILDDDWIEASKRVPIDVCQDLTEAEDLDAVLETMSHGRFIVHCYAETSDECNELIARIRSHESS